MITAQIPENDAGNAKMAIKEARRMNMELLQKAEELTPKEMACILQCAEEIKADPKKMKAAQPELDKMVKALKGLSGLKAKLSDAYMREMRKEEQKSRD